MGQRRFAVVMLSGGLDSTTVAAAAKRDGHEVLAVTVHYGQAHHRELRAAEEVAKALGIEQRVVDVSFFKQLAWYSALTQPERFGLPGGRTDEEIMRPSTGTAGAQVAREVGGTGEDIPITYVPLRNTFFLTLGAALLESQALHAIEKEGARPEEVRATLFIAANAIDYSGYPDCRPEFYASAAETLRLGSKLGTQYGVAVKIETPLIALSKAEIVRVGVEAGAPLEHTWSCYQGGERPCGRCDSCALRARGFSEASVADPAL